MNIHRTEESMFPEGSHLDLFICVFNFLLWDFLWPGHPKEEGVALTKRALAIMSAQKKN